MVRLTMKVGAGGAADMQKRWHTGGTLRARKWQLFMLTSNKALPGNAGYNWVPVLCLVVTT